MHDGSLCRARAAVNSVVTAVFRSVRTPSRALRQGGDKAVLVNPDTVTLARLFEPN